MEKKLSKRLWFNLLLFSFMGQIAWAVENVYFNTFLFNYIGGDTGHISTMVAASAATAVITTFVMGTLSDKLGKRKIFISLGYILWGVTVLAFAFISRENMASLFRLSDTSKILVATVSMVIVMDCVMTLMGSTSNDAAFNAWVTDVTTTGNRGVTESVLSLMPLFATAIVTVGFGAGVSAVGYSACFIFLGSLVIVCGVIGLFSLKDAPHIEKKNTNYFSDIIYGFRPSVIKENKTLYTTLSAVCLYAIAGQTFMPYVFIYIQHYMKIDFANLGALLTPPVLVVAVVGVVGFILGVIFLGKAVDKYGRAKFSFIAVAMFGIGLLLAFIAGKNVAFFLGAVLLTLLGSTLMGIVLNSTVRDFTPEDKVGLFQGVRMIFVVLIPMIIGPKLGSWATDTFALRHEGAVYTNDYGEIVNVPVPEIFLTAAIVCVLVLIPLFFIRKRFHEIDKK